MNSGTVFNRSFAVAVQGSLPWDIASAASARPDAPPIPPIIWLLNCSSVVSVISVYPSSRAFFSASRRTIPRRRLGARSMRFKAPSVQRTSITTASSESDALMVVLVSLLVEQFLEFLPGLEERDLLGRDCNRGAGFWIAPFLHAPRPEPETP